MSTELTTNLAGGKAYDLSAMGKLAQYAVTGISLGVASARPQADTHTLLRLAGKCSSDYVAKVAVYARTSGFIKDAPVLLLAHLSTREDKTWFHRAFPYVCNNVGQVRKLVEVIRSGIVGRRSLGSTIKRAIQGFFESKTAERLFWQAYGNNPSIGDVIKLSHPRPENTEKKALYAYFIDKPYEESELPRKVQAFERFKRGENNDIVPDVPFNRLVSLNLTTDQWEYVFRKMTWNQLRFNIVSAARKGLFERPRFVNWAAAKLADPEQIAKQQVLPFSLMKTLIHLESTNNVPQPIVKSMNRAVELSLANAPTFEGNVEVLLDTSGSMSAYRVQPTKNSTVSCLQVAAMYASALLAANPDNCTVTPFDTMVHPTSSISTKHSLAQNTKRLMQYGGGNTNISVGLEAILDRHQHGEPIPDTVIIISDNAGWLDSYRGNPYGTNTFKTWEQIKQINPSAKLICHNVYIDGTTPAPSRKDILNIGGWNDMVFDMIDIFTKYPNAGDWTDMINSVEL